MNVDCCGQIRFFFFPPLHCFCVVDKSAVNGGATTVHPSLVSPATMQWVRVAIERTAGGGRAELVLLSLFVRRHSPTSPSELAQKAGAFSHRPQIWWNLWQMAAFTGATGQTYAPSQKGIPPKGGRERGRRRGGGGRGLLV